MAFPREAHGEIEAKTIDMHVPHPIAQGIDHHLQDARMLEVQGVGIP